MQRREGQISVNKPPRGIGFVKQESWLQQGTVRDNIMWGTAYQFNWYNKVVEVCALKPDFDQLSRGDLTQVGEGGATLSGGQRARVALARAVYQDKDMYLIDDIFSAVDGDVAAHIYRKCILGLLKTKTRVLVTHHTRYIQAADNVLVLRDGQLVHQGPPGHGPQEDNGHMTTSPMDTNFSMLNTPSITGRNSPVLTPSSEIMVTQVDPQLVTPQEERRERGRVKLKVYTQYWRAVGCLLSLMILLSLVAMQVSRNLTDVWLAHWVTSETGNGTSPTLHLTISANTSCIWTLILTQTPPLSVSSII